MNFTELFIRRPVLSIVVSLMMLLLGFKAFDSLSVRQYPDVQYPVINVTTAYPGASAELVKGFITTPLQHAIATAEGISYITAISNENVSTIMAYLQPGYDINTALQEISTKVYKVRGELPRETEDPIVEKMVGLGSGILQFISFSSEQMSEAQITDYLSKVVQPVLSTIEGIGQATLRGKKTFAMRIWLNSTRMAAYNISADEVDQAINKHNVQSSAGQTQGAYWVFNIEAKTGLSSVEDFENIVVKHANGTLVRLNDVAKVELGAENYNSGIRFDGARAVFIETSAASSANPIEVAKRVRDVLPEIEAQLPPGVKLDLVFDTTFAIQRSIDEVVKTIFEASLIVIAVIFLFLGSFRSVIIPVVTIPLSLIGVLGLMLAMGFSVNLLTLLAMVLAIGLVVDDAIVVVENIQRHIEEGQEPMAAALIGAREIAFPVIAMTITLAAVYGPIGFLEGLTGTLFTEFAYTLAGAVIVSGIVALTLSPMMCAKLLKAQDDNNKNTLSKKLDRRFERVKSTYQRWLNDSLQHRPVIVLFSGAILCSIYFLYGEISQELAPNEDQGVVFVSGVAPLSANLDYLKAYTRQVEEIISEVPEMEENFIIDGLRGVNRFFSLVILKDWSERERSAMEIKDELSANLSTVAGLRIYAFNLPSIPSAGTGLPLQFVLTSTASDEVIYQVAENIVGEARKSGKFVYVSSELKFDKPQVQLHVDRDKAAELDVSVEEIGKTLSVLLGENYSSRFAYGSHSYQVIPQAQQDFRRNPDVLNYYYVKSERGVSVPLGALVSMELVSKPNKLSQFQQLNATYIGAMLAPGVTMGDGIEELNRIAERSLPAGFGHDYMGESRQFIEEGGVLALTFIFSFMLIYLVLAAQFESFTDPFIVLISVPMSIFGALIPMALGMATMNIYTQIGLVTLIGLISKHGILIVDFANKLQREKNLSPMDAVAEASVVRLRPILMTTAAMVFGVLPLLIASGAGAASRFSIGLVITSGMAIGTIFTLFVVPVMYTYLARDHRHKATSQHDEP